MSEEKKNTEENLPAFIKAAPELLPVWDWWVKEGKSTLLMLVVAAVVVLGFYGGRSFLRARNAAANQALVSAFTVEELETAVSNYGSTKAGPALRMRLAKAYYDAERYQDALDVYDKLVAKASSNPAFGDIAVVGRAHALEGLSKYKEAQTAFAEFAASSTNSYMILDAKLGAARCKALLGDKEGAAKDFDALKAAAKDDMEKERVERMADAVKRYDPSRSSRSLMDAANAAAKAIDGEKKSAETAKPAPAPAAKPAAPAPAPAPAAKPAAPAPAPAAKPAPAPVAKPAPAPAAKPAPAPAAKPAAPAPAPAPAAKPAPAPAAKPAPAPAAKPAPAPAAKPAPAPAAKPAPAPAAKPAPAPAAKPAPAPAAKPAPAPAAKPAAPAPAPAAK